MKRALLVAYYFPPLGHSGVMRAVQMHRLLPSYGIECDVLTVKPVLYWAYAPELLTMCHAHQVFRTGSYDKQRILYALGWRRFPKAGRSIVDNRPIKAFPDNKTGWIGPAVRLGKRLLEKRRYDLIISTSPPITGHLVAERLHESTHLPWIADFRDPWWSAPLEQVYNDPTTHAEGRALLARIRSKAAIITAVSRSIAEQVGALHVIPNGFDPQAATDWSSPDHTGPLTIGLLGTFDKTLPIWPLAATLKALGYPQGTLRIVQVGHTDRARLEQALEDHDVAADLECHGIQERRESILLLNRCHLFYVGYEQQGSYSLLPGRMPDLAVSGRPILAYAAPESEIARFLAEIPESFCFGKDTIAQAAHWLRNLDQRRQSGELHIAPHPVSYVHLSWKARIKALADLLRGVVEPHSASTG